MTAAAMKFERITPSARTKILMDVQFFLSENPDWTEGKLLRTAKMDWRFLERVRTGTFSTRSCDLLQETMEKIMAGEITEPTPAPQRKRKAKE